MKNKASPQRKRKSYKRQVEDPEDDNGYDKILDKLFTKPKGKPLSIDLTRFANSLSIQKWTEYVEIPNLSGGVQKIPWKNIMLSKHAKTVEEMRLRN